ncbi:unnamed protein product [Cochlearia groenlandica]
MAINLSTRRNRKLGLGFSSSNSIILQFNRRGFLRFISLVRLVKSKPRDRSLSSGILQETNTQNKYYYSNITILKLIEEDKQVIDLIDDEDEDEDSSKAVFVKEPSSKIAVRNGNKASLSLKKYDQVSYGPILRLTDEEEIEVNDAFSMRNRRKVLVSHKDSNIEIHGGTLQCLRPFAWLNDDVINIYLALLKERESRDTQYYLKCHFFNTFFYIKLVSNSGYNFKAVRRWTTRRKLGYDVFDCDIIFVPIHGGTHWTLAIIDKRKCKFLYLDSLNGSNPNVLNALAKYYVDEVKDKSGIDIDVSSWNFDYVKDLPLQRNGYDCGMFMLKYIDFYSRGLPLNFTQKDIPYFRLRIAKEILRLRAD